MNKIGNTESFLGSIFSGMRNSIIATTLGIGIYGFSRSFKNKKSKNIMKIISELFYIFAFLNLLNTNLMFNSFLSNLNNEEIHKLNKTFNFNYWKRFEYINWFLIALISILIVLGSSRFFRNVLNF